MMHRFAFLPVPVLLLAGLLAAGCSGNLRGDDDAREQEIQALKARILQLHKGAAINQGEVAQPRQKVAELDTRGGGTRPVTPPASPPSSRLAPAQPPVVRPVAPPPSPALRPAPAPAASAVSAPPAPVRREPLPAVAEPANQPIEVVDIDLPATGPQPPRPA